MSCHEEYDNIIVLYAVGSGKHFIQLFSKAMIRKSTSITVCRNFPINGNVSWGEFLCFQKFWGLQKN